MKSYQVENLTRLEYESAIKEKKGVLIPVGSCEQHGYHLPLGTDNFITQAICEEAAEQEDWLLMPLLPYGQVWSAQHFSGTFSLKEETLKYLLRDIIDSLQRQQVKNILVFSGHNGNLPVIKKLFRELLDEKGYQNLYYAGVELTESEKSFLESPRALCHHADELETSLMLCLQKDLVYLDRAETIYPKLTTLQKSQVTPWEVFNPIGSFGEVTKASVEKGQKIKEIILKKVIGLMQEIP